VDKPVDKYVNMPQKYILFSNAVAP
jgi:hypothetical protein